MLLFSESRHRRRACPDVGQSSGSRQADCGGSGRMPATVVSSPFLVYRDGGGHQQLVPLESGRERLTVGRGQQTDLWLDWDTQASRLHAAFERLGGDWTIVDDGLSRNGTYVNGGRVEGRRRLDDGDVLRCGSTELLFQAPRGQMHGETIDQGASPATVRAALEAAPDLAV